MLVAFEVYLEDFFVDCLCLKAVDFKENDKIVSFYSGEIGKINVVAKGCKSQKAKLKFACSPFCFGKYFFSQKGNKYILLGCDCYDSFFDLTQDLKKYYAGAVALEFLDKMCMEGDYNHELFVVTLKYLKELCYGTYEINKLVALYLKRALGFLGYADSELAPSEYFEYIRNEFSVEIKALKMFCDLQ